MQAALFITLSGIPIAFVGLTFLHAARAPQWAWAMVGRPQAMWLAGLLIGAAVIPLGIPAAVYYLIKIRPALTDVESGDLRRVLKTSDTGPQDLPPS